LVLTEKRERESSAEETGHVRAADILAQRLPSVPDKPAVDPKAAGGTGTKPGVGDSQKSQATVASPKKPSITLDEAAGSKPKITNTNPLTTFPTTTKPKPPVASPGVLPATPPGTPPASQTPAQSPD